MEVIEGFTFEPINDEHTEEIIKNSFAKNASYANTIIHPSECAMSDKYKKYIKRILDFEVYSDDTWVITFPKCGKFENFVDIKNFRAQVERCLVGGL